MYLSILLLNLEIFKLLKTEGATVLIKRMRDDVKMVFEQDPAARTTFEVITTYAGLHAVWSHLIAHKLYNKNAMYWRELYLKYHVSLQVLKYIRARKLASAYL